MRSPYARLFIAIGINAVIMFFLTYALLASTDHFYANINRAYMAVLMAAPMVVIMVGVMWPMYGKSRLNIGLLVGAVAVFGIVFALARTQTPIGNDQFLRSMIPHHSSAILMCNEANLTDDEIIALCGEIVEAQRREIAQMQDILERFAR